MEKAKLKLVKLSEVQEKEIEWLWPGRIPRGFITNILGDPGIGKGVLTGHIISQLTTGRMLPGMKESVRPINAIVLSMEDDKEKVLKPRYRTMGADLERVFCYDGFVTADARSQQQFDLKKLPELESRIVEHKAELVVIDPLTDFTGEANINKAEDVIGVLNPVIELAARHNISIICCVHCNKSEVKALYKGIGSIQFAGKARSVLFIERNPEDETERVICQIKSNLEEFTPSLSFTTVNSQGYPRLEWIEAHEGKWTANDFIDPTTNKSNKFEIAKALLFGALTNGPRRATEIESLAKKLDIGDSTLKRARNDLKADSNRSGGVGENGYWLWSLPGYEESPPSCDHPLNSLREETAQRLSEKVDKLLKTLSNQSPGEQPLRDQLLSKAKTLRGSRMGLEVAYPLPPTLPRECASDPENTPAVADDLDSETIFKAEFTSAISAIREPNSLTETEAESWLAWSEDWLPLPKLKT